MKQDFPHIDDYIHFNSYRFYVDLINRRVEIKFRENNELLNLVFNSEDYLRLKKGISEGSLNLNSFKFSDESMNFFRTSIAQLIFELNSDLISSVQFIDHSFELLNLFGKSTLLHRHSPPKLLNGNLPEEFISISEEIASYYRLCKRYDLVEALIQLSFVKADFSLLHDVEFYLKRRILSADILFDQLGIISRLNKFTQKDIISYQEFIDKILNSIYGQDKSFMKALFGKNKDVVGLNAEFPQDYPSFTKHLSQFGEINKAYFKTQSKLEPCITYLKVRRTFKGRYKGRWLGSDYSTFAPFSPWLSFNHFLENIVYQIFFSIILNNENSFREDKGLPRIGEGWVSETNLYNELKSHFKSSVTIIHHGKPRWLKRQHVDIWFPKFKIGIEYHGEQHFKPIDFFGGQDGFVKGQERDERKRELFKKNGATLIEVMSGYDLKELISIIEDAMKAYP